MTCRHCHVDAGPDRVEANMSRETVDACLRALDQTPATTVDITGGAPELNPHFAYLVDQCVARGLHVMDRCNLTILTLQRYAHLPEWLGERGVEVVASLPHHRKPNTDAQRGEGTFDRSIEALRALNAVGYGQGDPRRRLTLMHNPSGAWLPGAQASMEREWKASLERAHGVRFDRLIALNNMPISRFLEWLVASGNLDTYMERLVAGFNPATVRGLMCRNTLSIGWDGGTETCADCHMPEVERPIVPGGPVRKGRRHLFRGAWDDAFAATAVRVEMDAAGRLVLTNEAGHRFPTADPARLVRVTASALVGGTTVESIEERIERRVKLPRLVDIVDTTLGPMERRELHFRFRRRPDAWRVQVVFDRLGNDDYLAAAASRDPALVLFEGEHPW